MLLLQVNSRCSTPSSRQLAEHSLKLLRRSLCSRFVCSHLVGEASERESKPGSKRTEIPLGGQRLSSGFATACCLRPNDERATTEAAAMSGRRKRPSALDSDFDEPEPPPPPPDDAELQLQRMTAAFHATPQPTMAQPALEPLTTVQQAHHLCASAQWTPHNQVMLVPLGRSPLSVNLLALFAYGAWKSDEQGQPIQYARPEVHPPPKVIIKTHLELGKGAHSEPVFVLSYDNPRDADAAARMVGPMLAQALDNQPFEILGGNWQSSLAYSPVTFSERTWVESALLRSLAFFPR